MHRGNKICCAKSGLNAKHCRHAYKCSKIFFSRTGGLIFTKLGSLVSVIPAHYSLFKKKGSKIFFSRPGGPIFLKLRIKDLSAYWLSSL